MSLEKLIIGLGIIIFSLTALAQDNSKVKVKFHAKLKSVEKFGKPLKNTHAFIYKNGQLIDSVLSNRGSVKFSLPSGHLYKIEFTKLDYVSKHVIINTIEIPKKSIRNIKLKADINLFKFRKEIDAGFLKYEPVSIAYFNFENNNLVWDYDYNRSVVEKIILSYIKK